MRVEIAGTERTAIVGTLRKQQQLIVHLVIIDLDSRIDVQSHDRVQIFDDEGAELFLGEVYRAVTGRIGAFGLFDFWTVLAIPPGGDIPDPTLIIAFSDVEAARQIDEGLGEMLARDGISYQSGFPIPGQKHDGAGNLTIVTRLSQADILENPSRFEEGQTGLWFRRSVDTNIPGVTIAKKYGPPPQIGRDGELTNHWLYDLAWNNGASTAPMIEEPRIGLTEEEVDL